MKQGFGNDLIEYGTYSHFTGVKERYPEKEKDFPQNMQQINAFLVPLPAQEASLVAQMVKNLPAMQETWVQSLGWEVPLEKRMATTPLFLPEESHGQRSLAGYSPWGHKESNTTT